MGNGLRAESMCWTRDAQKVRADAGAQEPNAVNCAMSRSKALTRHLSGATLATAMALLTLPTLAASLDCAAARTRVERLICDTSELSQLDSELAMAYRAVLAEPARATLARRAQEHWLKERDACQDIACVEAAYRRRIGVLAIPTADKDAAYGFKGEFILSRNEYQNPFCQRFTQNLNQFRKLDFEVCHPRLSDRFPEISRPKWEEIPFDVVLAEEVVKDWVSLRRINADAAKRAETLWERWRTGLSPLLASGQARMWRTRIDLDGDGSAETIVRMVPGEGIPTQIGTTLPSNCDTNSGAVHMMDNIHQEVSDVFNTGFHGSDIIYFAEDKRYYRVLWHYGRADMDTYIGATAGVSVSKLNWNGSLVTGGGNECLIEWVPTGKYVPL